MAELPDAATPRVADASDVDAVADLSRGQDVVIGATRPAPGHEVDGFTVTRSLLAGCARTGVRVIIVGGAGSLIVPGTDGRLAIDDPDVVAPAWRAIARVGVDQLSACRNERVADWTHLSPPAHLQPGQRTGRYRTGSDELLVAPDGTSSISIEDFAVALLDEVDVPRHPQARFTVAN
jgi:putative NADH-flavin reductase